MEKWVASGDIVFLYFCESVAIALAIVLAIVLVVIDAENR